MLSRYKIPYMSKLDPTAPEAGADAVRQDTRKHTKHCLRPDAEKVKVYLDGEIPWQQFASDYRDLLAARFKADSTEFDDLAKLATSADVFLGCSCPTKQNPDVKHCHTFLALQFMADRYPQLAIEFPSTPEK